MSLGTQNKEVAKPAFLSLMIIATMVTVFAQVADAQTELRRTTIGAGGAVRSTAGRYELSGSVTPVETAVSRGDRVALTGGFWYRVPPGDADGSGAVGLSDVAAFEACLTGPAESPAPDCGSFDTDRSGAVDLRDFAETQMRFSGA